MSASIITGDIMNGDMAKLSHGKPFDLVHTDPPWNTGIMRMFYKWAGKSTKATITHLFEAMITELQLHAPDAVIVVYMGRQNIDLLCSMLAEVGCVQLNLWNTEWQASASQRRPQFVWRGSFSDRYSPIDTDPPTDLVGYELSRYLIEQETGTRVLDPFIGYGLTARICAELGLDCYGMDLGEYRVREARKHDRGV